MKSDFDVEEFQKCCDDPGSFNDDYEVCLDAWNGLKASRTSTGVAAAMGSKLKYDFMILRLQTVCECLVSSPMMFMMCWEHWFGLHCSLTSNPIVTWFRS